MTRSSLLAIAVLAASAAHGFQMKDQDNVVFLNANQENVSCLTPRSAKPGPTTFCPNVPDEALHLIQGRRMEFMVVNRPFLARPPSTGASPESSFWSRCERSFSTAAKH